MTTRSALEVSVAWLGRVLVIAVSLGLALGPLGSIAGDAVLVTALEVVPPWVGIALLVGAGVLEGATDRSPSSYLGFAVATLACWSLFAWLTGLSSLRLELAPTVLLAEALVYLAAVATAAALVFRTDWESALERDDRSRSGESSP